MSSAHQRPPRKKPGITWPVAIVALVGLGFGLQSLWKHLFHPNPELPQGYLIFSYFLDGITIVACSAALILFLVKLASQGKS
jgi:hypothetical protein